MKDLHSPSNCWQTPDWLFKELNEEFNFDIDLCATEQNSKCKLFGEDYLNDCYESAAVNNSMLGFPLNTLRPKVNTAFMNPPYSNPKPFIEKAWEDSKHCKIVCLVKCDPSTKWWATFWNHLPVVRVFPDGKQEWEKDGTKPGCEVRFFPKRIKFDPPASLNLEIKGNKYSIRCDDFDTIGSSKNSFLDKSPCNGATCLRCKGTGKRWANLAGASFPCALIIMDRREI